MKAKDKIKATEISVADKISHLYYRITNAIKIGWWTYKHPEVFNGSHFKLMADLLALIFKVANEGRHMMTHIAYLHPTEGEQNIVSIWAGAGMDADPLDRIAELIKENSRLKAELSFCISKKQEENIKTTNP